MSVKRESDGSLWKYLPSPPIDDMEYMRRYSEGECKCPVCLGDGYEMTWTLEDADSIPLELDHIRSVNIGSHFRPYYVPARPACTFCEGYGWVMRRSLGINK